MPRSLPILIKQKGFSIHAGNRGISPNRKAASVFEIIDLLLRPLA